MTPLNALDTIGEPTMDASTTAGAAVLAAVVNLCTFLFQHAEILAALGAVFGGVSVGLVIASAAQGVRRRESAARAAYFAHASALDPARHLTRSTARTLAVLALSLVSTRTH